MAATCASRMPRLNSSWRACTIANTSRCMSETAGRATALDADTFTSPDSYEVALLAAGAAIAGVDHVLDGVWPPRLRDGAAARPSRRAEPRDGLLSAQQRCGGRASQRARKACSAWRSSITTCITATAPSGAFYDDPSVLFISSASVPVLPGHRSGTRSGTGPGRRLSPSICRWMRRHRRRLRARLRHHCVSGTAAVPSGARAHFGGFDALEDDPLGGMRLSADRVRAADLDALRRSPTNMPRDAS
jgi:acetoin utilization deacetylase AcuC-like enzyme